MDTDDLQQLASHLGKHGLQVAIDEANLRLRVTNPLNSRLTEEILAANDEYTTSFDHEIGERGHEQACAERIARVLAVDTRLMDTPS